MFAQQFCLVPNEKEIDECRNDRFKYFLKTMLRIGDRIKARSVLDVTCRNASALKLMDTLTENFKKLIPNRDICILSNFKPINSADVLTAGAFSKRQQAILTALAESGQLHNGFQFISNIEQNGKVKIGALMHIPRAYPENGASSLVLLVPAGNEKYEYLAALEVWNHSDLFF